VNPSNQELLAKLNLETGRLTWREVERHFARGVVVKVGAQLDLVEVAMHMASDDKAVMTRWLESGHVARAATDDAIGWNDRQSTFWAVVVAPWVLVQEIRKPQ
jgi:hypothetical protein